MNRALWLWALVALPCLLVYGSEVTKPNAATSGTVEAKAFEPVVIESDFEPTADRVVILYDWEFARPVQAREVVIGGKRQLFVWAPPGEYEVTEEIVTGAKLDTGGVTEPFDKTVNVFKVRITGGVPVDPDEPDPPDPMVGRVASILILRDPMTDTPQEARVLLELRTHAQFARPPPQLIVLDHDQEAANGQLDPLAAQYGKFRTAGAGFPYFFLLDAKEKVIQHGEVGTDTDAFLAIVRSRSR